jgi:FYVE zinc finger/Zinc finger, C3HC4 type (RING finger)
MDVGTKGPEWADFKADVPLDVAKNKRSSRRQTTSGDASCSRWMTAPINSEDVTPLAPPGNRSPQKQISSPKQGSAISKARWSTTVPVLSVRSPKSISSFSRKKEIAFEASPTTLAHSSRTVSTSAAGSSSESDKEQIPPTALRAELDVRPLSPRPEVRKPPTSRDSKRAPLSPQQAATVRGRSSVRGGGQVAARSRSATRSGQMTASPATSQPKLRSSSRGRPTSSSKQKSRGRGRTPTPTSPRGRSLSQPRATSTTPRSRSTSSHNSRLSSSSQRSRSATRPRPPLTKENSRTGRNRSRSASLTRVSNDQRMVTSPLARTHRPPPSTYRTRQELREAASPMRTRTLSESDARSAHSFNAWTFGTGVTFDSNGSGPLLERSANKKSGMLETLLGNQVGMASPIRIAGSLGCEIRPRILLAATVYHNTATNLWITTINTNQRGVAKNPATANKFLKAFSFATEREARESAIANAPPKMVPFNESPECFSCKGKFAVFRRAGHCRNCGVCVCSSCSTTWPAKMIPATYNLKNEAQVKICRTCNSLSSSFKKALLNGNLDQAMALYGTGNINLRTPFAVSNKKDEIMHPVHCAAAGGNLNLLRWLIEDHFSPIKCHRVGSSKKGTQRSSDSPILTSKGRSILTIAIENLKVDMLRYLVVECGVSIFECKDLKSSLSALEAALTILPPVHHTFSRQHVVRRLDIPRTASHWDRASFVDDNFSELSSLGAEEQHGPDESMTIASRHSSRVSNGDVCIICFDRKIDCVATPCGHQICCLECSTNLKVCPVCNDRGSFIKIFRP